MMSIRFSRPQTTINFYRCRWNDRVEKKTNKLSSLGGTVMGNVASEAKGRGSKFIKDLMIYAIGNIGSKFVTFILVPLYTFFITDPAEYGYYDICQTLAFCLIPIVTFQFIEGSYRFLVSSITTSERQSIVTYVYCTLIRNAICISIIGAIFDAFFEVKYLLFIICFGIAQSVYEITLQVIRGLGNIRLYVSGSIFNSFVIVAFSIIFVVILRLEVIGIFLTNILSRCASVIYMQRRERLFKKYFSYKSDLKIIKNQLLRYSLPLLPLAMAWWVLNTNNVFFIKQYLGLEENGIYAILAKFTSILFVLSNIFYQTWQQNAIEEYDRDKESNFFSKVFNYYIYILCFLVSVFPFVIKLNIKWLVSEEYWACAEYLYLNSIFVMMYALAAFFELGYQCSKKTSRLLPSIFFAAIINVGMNHLLIPILGLNGVIISGILTFLILGMVRWVDTQKYIHVVFAWRTVTHLMVLAVSGMAYYSINSISGEIVSVCVLTTLYVAMMPEELRNNLMLKFKRLFVKQN